MNQLKRLLLAAGATVLGFSSPIAEGATVIVDNFNSYANAVQLQKMPGTNWSRFGEAVSDGIYSIAGGVEGRGANILLIYDTASKVNASVRYTYAAPQSFEGYITISMDIAVDFARPGTQVFAQIGSTSPTGLPADATIFETRVGQSLTNTSYQNFTFSFAPENIRLIQGDKTFNQLMNDLSSITLRFNNTTDAVSQTIRFDNLTLTSIPEPSIALLSLLGGGLAIAMLRRRRSCAKTD